MNDRTNQVTVGVVVIILVLGAWYFGRMQATSPVVANQTADIFYKETSANVKMETASERPTKEDPSVKASGESVTVVDQTAGGVVKVASVTLAETSWIAVRDSNGRVLGAGRFSEGTSKDIEVTLMRNTVAGEKYQLLLYVDDGDKEYDLHKDSLVMNADASVVGAVFTAK